MVLKNNSSKKDISNISKKMKAIGANGFNAKKFNGIISIKEDPLEIQKKLRNEWERNIN